MPICEGCRTIMSHEESQEAYEKEWPGYCPECIVHEEERQGQWRREEQNAKVERNSFPA